MRRWLPNLIARIFGGPPKDPADEGTATWESLARWAKCALRGHQWKPAGVERDAFGNVIVWRPNPCCDCGARKEGQP